MHNNKTYATINLTELSLIDFSQILENSSSTIRKSLDNTEFIIKWNDGNVPTFISDTTVIPVGTYDHHAMIELMATAEWTPEEPPE